MDPMSKTRTFTIGLTKKDAETFFTKLKHTGVKRVIDVRHNNTSQLAGFTKKDDLHFFLKEICICEYQHIPLLAPTNDLLDGYRNKNTDWPEYELKFNKLLNDRKAEELLSCEELDMACFLCSEPTPNRCHRCLVAENFKNRIGNVEITHL